MSGVCQGRVEGVLRVCRGHVKGVPLVRWLNMFKLWLNRGQFGQTIFFEFALLTDYVGDFFVRHRQVCSLVLLCACKVWPCFSACLAVFRDPSIYVMRFLLFLLLDELVEFCPRWVPVVVFSRLSLYLYGFMVCVLMLIMLSAVELLSSVGGSYVQACPGPM